MERTRPEAPVLPASRSRSRPAIPRPPEDPERSRRRALAWNRNFPSAAPILAEQTFADLATLLVVSAVDLATDDGVSLNSRESLPAVRGTCALPGAIDPDWVDDRYLVDGGVTSILPVDRAWSADSDVVIAVNIVARPRPMRRLDCVLCRVDRQLGRLVPISLTACYSFGIVMRIVEIALERKRAMAVAMTGPEMLIDVDLGDISVGDFHVSTKVGAMGGHATETALPLRLCPTGHAASASGNLTKLLVS